MTEEKDNSLDSRIDRIEEMLNKQHNQSDQIASIQGMVRKNYQTLQSKIKDIALLGFLAANLFMNLLSLLGLSISFASYDVPVLECKVVNDGTQHLECFRPDESVIDPVEE